jgi:hypothetical protein
MDYACSNAVCSEYGKAVTLPEAAHLCCRCQSQMKRCSGASGTRHFVQYHKTDEWGPPGSREGAFGIDTNKKAVVDTAYGGTIWLVTGEGSPKEYFLDCVFIADRVRVNDGFDEYKRYSVLGKRGRKLRSPIRLNGFGWFRELPESLADFGAGFSEIGSGTAAKLQELIRSHGIKTLTE